MLVHVYIIVYSVWDPGPRTGTRYGMVISFFWAYYNYSFIALALYMYYLCTYVLSLNINVVNN